LKVDASKTGNDYTKNLPFSPYLKKQLAQFSRVRLQETKGLRRQLRVTGVALVNAMSSPWVVAKTAFGVPQAAQTRS
jgi:hypothetical protein